MLSSRSQWSSKQNEERDRFQLESSKYLDEQFEELNVLLSDLHMSRTAHIKSLIQAGEAELEKARYESEMRRLELKRQQEEERLALEKEREERQAKIAAEKEREKERQKSLELAEKAAAEKASAAKAKLEAEAKEKEQRRIAEEKKANALKAEKAAKEAAALAKKKEDEAKSASLGHVNSTNMNKGQSKAKATNNKQQIESEYMANIERIHWIKQNVKEAMKAQPSEVKKQTMEIKLQLRPKFGMLTNSQKQLFMCRRAISDIITPIRQNQLIYHWVLNIYAKMLVEQSESEANVKLQNALPLGMLTMLLWNDFPELGSFVIPRIVKRCPQVIGYYCSINTKEGRKAMGWRLDDDTGKYETEEKYMGRLSGICAVWSCMTQTKFNAKLTHGKDHPYPLSHSWTFVARHLNKPISDVGPTDYALVAAWWDMTARRLGEAFGRQGTKLLDLVWDTWTAGRDDPPAMRLRGLGENWKSTGVIEAAWKPMAP